MATVAIGDIHGNREALEDLLARLEVALQTYDTVMFLGDYIDRGSDSKGCIDRILQCSRRESSDRGYVGWESRRLAPEDS